MRRWGWVIPIWLWASPAFGGTACAYLDGEAFRAGANNAVAGAAYLSTEGISPYQKTIWQFPYSTNPVTDYGITTDKFWMPLNLTATYITPYVLWRANSTDTTKRVCWEICIEAAPEGANYADLDGGHANCVSGGLDYDLVGSTANRTLVKTLAPVTVIDATTNAACATPAACKNSRTVTTVKRVQCTTSSFQSNAELEGVVLCWQN